MTDSVNKALDGFDRLIHVKESNFAEMDADQQKEMSRADNEARGKLTTFFIRGFFFQLRVAVSLFFFIIIVRFYGWSH
ncbi:hypothetical protein [Providencia rettgeri]|uniref:hypothetical protein n=1 Tax=Providencia rettgeri TaxID=587 RepID=UPI0034E07B2B